MMMMMMMKVDWNVSHWSCTSFCQLRTRLFWFLRCWQRAVPVSNGTRLCRSLRHGAEIPRADAKLWEGHGLVWNMAVDDFHGDFLWWFHGDFTIDDDFHIFSWWFRECFMVISWWFPMEFIQASLCPGFIAASGGRVNVLEQFAVAGGLPRLATLQLELFQTSAALAAADDGLPKPAAGGNHVEPWNQQNIWWDVDGCWLYDDVIVVS